jgi:hypothetical protein
MRVLSPHPCRPSEPLAGRVAKLEHDSVVRPPAPKLAVLEKKEGLPMPDDIQPTLTLEGAD